MRPPFLRLSVLALLVWLGLPSPGRAQFAVPNDPFYLYYGYVLPNQNQLDNQIQQQRIRRLESDLSSARQQGLNDRADLYSRLSQYERQRDAEFQAFMNGTPLPRPHVVARTDRAAIARGLGPAR